MPLAAAVAPSRRHRAVLAAATALVLLLGVPGCASSGEPTGAGDGAAATDAPPSQGPGDGADASTVVGPGARPEALTIHPVLAVTGCTDDAPADVVPSTDGSGCYQLGPAGADGTDLEGADAVLQEDWVVTVRARPEAAERVGALFDACAAAAESCPTFSVDAHGAVAFVLDGTVISAPTVNAPGIADDTFVIAGAFDEADARALAATLTP